MNTSTTPNLEQTMPEAATSNNAVPSLDSIAQKMAAMRNQVQATRQTAPGEQAEANAGTPVAPTDNVEPEVELPQDDDVEAGTEEDIAPEAQDDEVSEPEADTTAQEIIDFVEFAETNPNAKFKFMKNGKEVVIDAKKAAAILGQGSAIHEEARQLKIERAEFEEYLNDVRARQEGLTLAMEFTVQPKLQKAYDEIVKTQNYQTTFQQQLNGTRDPAQVARIQASMAQNEQYIRQQQQVISQLKPAVDEFKQIRTQQVGTLLTEMRKNFTDKELKNEFVYNEIRDKVSKIWKDAKTEIVPGIPNIDLISSDESLLSLIRDGLRYRDKPATRSSGASMAALTSRKGSSTQRNNDDGMSKLREIGRAHV